MGSITGIAEMESPQTQDFNFKNIKKQKPQDL